MTAEALYYGGRGKPGAIELSPAAHQKPGPWADIPTGMPLDEGTAMLIKHCLIQFEAEVVEAPPADATADQAPETQSGDAKTPPNPEKAVTGDSGSTAKPTDKKRKGLFGKRGK
jgi:hypothetical protein